MARMKKIRKSPEAVLEIDLTNYPLPSAIPPASLKADQCRWRIDHKTLGFKTTNDVKPLTTLIGQPRAIKALQLGAQIRGKGYNVFVTGLSATGRSTAVQNIFGSLEVKNVLRHDYCYVNNFKNPDEPRLLTLPANKGHVFKTEVTALIDNLKNMIPHALDDDSILNRKRILAEEYANKEAKIFKTLEDKVAKDGFALVQVQMGPYTRPDVFPVIDGEPVPPNQVGKKVEEGKYPGDKLDSLYERYQGFKLELRAVMKQVRTLNRELADKTTAIDKQVLEELLKDYCQDLTEKFQQESVGEYLGEVQDFIIDHTDIFSTDESEQPNSPVPAQLQIPNPFEEMTKLDPYKVFEVNVIHDNAKAKKAPVVVEHHPNYHNLFGTIEREMRYGGLWATDFTQIKGGSLLKADGGYLILNAMDVLQEPMSWRTLMRTLKTGKLQIQGMDTLLSIAPATIKPEPIDINVTVILIGDSYLYHMLSYYEEDFHRVFKVRADFDSLMPRGKKEIRYYAALARKMTNNEKTLPMTAKAIARLSERGARLSGSGDKMSARLGRIADIIREANQHALNKNSKVINDSHVEEAISESEYRQDLVRERIDEAFGDEIYMIDTEGYSVGQINGLAVHDLGNFAFGRPQRITCEISMGDAGVVNIEREAKLSGSIHNKGTMILEGYLRHQYGMDGPISLSASIAFEQSYSKIDGDSASIAEIAVLLSALSDLPLRQDLAVTGSMNQKGEVQPIGGINEKVEGFFRICKIKGLTGTQGVVMPKSNVKELMLSDEVLAAIAAGTFSIYPVTTADQAIEIFTGVKAGRKLKSGGWTKGGMHDRVDITLSDIYWRLKSGAEEPEDHEHEEEEKEKPKKKLAEKRRKK
ncbi:MAG: ATP-binding protein [bacterium]|nr:ATP-binding protein [bacterium]